jgi:hypothetical protein
MIPKVGMGTYFFDFTDVTHIQHRRAEIKTASTQGFMKKGNRHAWQLWLKSDGYALATS